MAQFQKILALDTALNDCSAAVYDEGKVFSESVAMMQGHAEHLIPMAERALKKSGVDYADIEAVAVTAGPGAFTGLRIGLSAARAIGLALGVPVYGITTTQILALQAVRENAEPVMVVLDTKRSDYYVQSFDAGGKPLSDASVMNGEAIKADGFVLIGDGVERLTGEKSAITAIDAALMAELLATKPELFNLGAAPAYLRGADVTESKRQNRIFEGAQGLK
ncbi:MAG: tRNA (adenosine(37)-N6)-threonylcarbamoyltransferase complex dimerization subunit type 1 TsaB [Alphaproteobacteria bacterium PRO2]|nr:tRNA (adenosine(37)-N6)-threonylcarbamoyltransferase complex dimerization subunit type 1 TsaB [Alphaproteobacteria bacterium PRO2]